MHSCPGGDRLTCSNGIGLLCGPHDRSSLTSKESARARNAFCRRARAMTPCAATHLLPACRLNARVNTEDPSASQDATAALKVAIIAPRLKSVLPDVLAMTFSYTAREFTVANEKAAHRSDPLLFCTRDMNLCWSEVPGSFSSHLIFMFIKSSNVSLSYFTDFS